MADHFAAHASVVVLVADGAAPARIIQLLSHDDLLIPILVGLAIHDLPARRLLVPEADVRQNHRSPPLLATLDTRRGASRRGPGVAASLPRPRAGRELF